MSLQGLFMTAGSIKFCSLIVDPFRGAFAPRSHPTLIINSSIRFSNQIAPIFDDFGANFTNFISALPNFEDRHGFSSVFMFVF